MNLTLQEKDALTRQLETGVSRASEKLGKLSKTEWGIMTSSIKEIPPVRLLSWFNRCDKEHVSARFRCAESVPLEILVLFPVSSAQTVTEAVVKPFAERMGKIPNLVEATIGEVSNIMAQGLISAMADDFDQILILSVPEMGRDRKVKLLSQALEAYDGREDVLLMSHIEMYSESLSAECGMVVWVKIAALRNLFAKSQKQ
jgi:chemotaxis protein CheY-P-specific phosphatase CheC